jgi:N-acetylneuraminic acid mutarotase
MKGRCVPVAFWFFLCVVATSEGQIGQGSWQNLAPLPTARQELATAVLDGKIYVIGGYDQNIASTSTVEVYNPATNTWASAQPIPFPNNHNSAAVAAGKLYSFGGASNQVFVYEPGSNTWSAVAPMHFQHDGSPGVGVINDKIYVAGGVGPGMNQRELEVYDPVANTWTNLASMRVARNHAAGGVINGKFYVAGGRGSTEAPTALEMYNPQANTWSTLANMPTGRSGTAAGVVNGELYVFGGEIPNRVRGEVEAYTPSSNSWRSLPDMPTPRHGIWGSVIDNKIYLPGGATEPAFAATNINDVFIVGIASKATLSNISTRALVQTDNHVLIGGFVISGSSSKTLLLRAIGPTLSNFNVPSPLQDPVLSLHNTTTEIANNDDWQTDPNASQIPPTLRPTDARESALLTVLQPGQYTAIVSGKGETSGVGLVEVYDMDSSGSATLINLSTRGVVQTGDFVMIGGLIPDGAPGSLAQVLVRAIGPSLAQFNITDALADPTLRLIDSNGATIGSNDNWKDTQQTEIQATGKAPADDRESAIILTLAPASYTAIVQGSNGAVGVALVEVYALN